MLPALDSHYEAVVARMATINPSRQMLGMVEAQDWPPQEVQFEAFYCLVLGANPGTLYSPFSMPMAHQLQWVWALMGKDIATGVRGRNRGDRYRTNHTMEQELLKALYPYFTPKLFWSVDTNGALQSSPTPPNQPTAPEDNIWWTVPRFMSRVDKESGLIYNSAAVSVNDITEAVVA